MNESSELHKKQFQLAYIHNALDGRGGAERKMLLLAQHFAAVPDVSLSVYVNSYVPEKTFQEYLSGLSIESVPARNPLAKLIACWKIGRLTKDADLIHAHNHPGHIAAAFSKWFRSKPVLWFCNEPLLYLAGTRKREPLLKLIGTRLFERLVLSKIDIIVANSENTARNIKKYLKRDSVVIYSGVDTRLLCPPAARSPKSRPQLVSLCRFTKEKNIDFVLRLAERSPELDFVIAGNGPIEGELKSEIENKKLTNTRLAVNISEDEKVKLYQESDVFVFPTLHEPLGINIVEAMACGVPTVAFSSGGARETVANSETGYLVDTEAEFEAKLKEIAGNPSLREKMSAAARARAVAVFSLEQMIQKTAQLYNDLLAKYQDPFRFS